VNVVIPLVGLAIAIGMLVAVGAACFLVSAARTGKHRHEGHANS